MNAFSFVCSLEHGSSSSFYITLTKSVCTPVFCALLMSAAPLRCNVCPFFFPFFPPPIPFSFFFGGFQTQSAAETQSARMWLGVTERKRSAACILIRSTKSTTRVALLQKVLVTDGLALCLLLFQPPALPLPPLSRQPLPSQMCLRG